MVKDLAIILKAKFSSLKNSLQPRQARTRSFYLFLLGLGFILLAYLGSYWLFGYFRSVAMDEPDFGLGLVGDLLNRMMLSLVFLVFLSVLIFSNLITGLSSHFLADDLELLNSMPVKKESLFISRFLEALLESSWMLFVFGLPIFFAFGACYQLDPGYYFLVLLVLVCFLLIPAGLAQSLVIILVNTFPARRVRDLLFLLSIFALGIIVVLFRIIRPERLVNPEVQETLFEFLLTLRQPMSIWLPSYWASEALFRYSQEGWQGAKIFLPLLLAGALFSFYLAYWLWLWLYPEGYSKAQEASRAPLSTSSPVQRVLNFFSSPFHPSLRQILLKEIKTFLRDTSQWSQLFLLGALMVIYIFNFRVLPLDKIPFDQFKLKNAVCYLNMGLAGFVLSALSARFVFPMVSLEGRSFWLIKTAPITMRRFLWSKFWLSWPGLMLIGEALIIITNYYLKVSGVVWWTSTVSLFFLSFAVVGMALGFGALYPRFYIDNPAKIAVGFGGAVYMIVAMLMIFLVVIAEAYPTYVFFIAHHNQVPVNISGWGSAFLAGAVVLGVSSIGLFLPIKAGIKKLEELEF